MRKFIDKIVHQGAKLVETEFKERGDGHTLITRRSIVPNEGKYLTLPENVKRCYYLDANEKLVLFELYSWASEDGKCQVAMDLVSLQLGITEKTVRTCVQKLEKKKFLHKSRQGRSNVYRFDDLKNNPYLVLSEFIHGFIADYYYIGSLRKDEEWVQSVGDEGMRLWREAVVNTLAMKAKKKTFYESYLQRLTETPDDYENVHSSFVDELLQFVNESAMKKASKNGLISETV